MKKYLSLSVAIAVLCSGCQLFQKEEVPTVTTPNMTASVSESMVASSDTSSEVSSEPVATEVFLFDETILGDTVYPKTSVPLEVPKDELLAAMNDYYKAEYSENERALNRTRITDDDLDAIQQLLDTDSTLQPLKASVRQISFTLDGETVYVPQIIVPMAKDAAFSQFADNDVQLLNQTLAIVGNRLIMIAYYDTHTQTLLPLHLTNSSNPLFYYGE